MRYGLEILHQCGKRVKTIIRKVLGANSNVCRSYRGKIARGPFCPPILNKVNATMSEVAGHRKFIEIILVSTLNIVISPIN